MARTSEFALDHFAQLVVILIEDNSHRLRTSYDLNVHSSSSSSSTLIARFSTTREFSSSFRCYGSLTGRSLDRPDPVISIDEPSPDNLLQFRSRDKPSKMRFTKETFRDIPTSPASAIPDDAFDAVLQDVLKLERSFGSDDDSEESDDLPDPSQLGTSQRSKKSTQGKRPASSDKESEAEGDAVKPSDSDEDLLKEDEEIDKFVSILSSLLSLTHTSDNLG